MRRKTKLKPSSPITLLFSSLTLWCTQTWVQDQKGHQRATTEKPFWCPQSMRDGWRQNTSSQRSGCPNKEVNEKPFACITWDYTMSEKRNVKGDLSSKVLRRQRQQGKYNATSPSFTLWKLQKAYLIVKENSMRVPLTWALWRGVSASAHISIQDTPTAPIPLVPPLLKVESPVFHCLGWMPTHDRDLPACLQASPQRHTDLSQFDGCFCNHYRHLWLVFELQCNTRVMDTEMALAWQTLIDSWFTVVQNRLQYCFGVLPFSC